MALPYRLGDPLDDVGTMLTVSAYAHQAITDTAGKG